MFNYLLLFLFLVNISKCENEYESNVRELSFRLIKIKIN